MSYQNQIERTFVSLSVAATKLGVPSAWLRREAQAGRIPVIRAGRRWLVHLERARAKLAEDADHQVEDEQ